MVVEDFNMKRMAIDWDILFSILSTACLRKA